MRSDCHVLVAPIFLPLFMPPLHATRALPTHAEITTFLQTFLPYQTPTTSTSTRKDGTVSTVIKSDVNFLYHSPRHPTYRPTRHVVSRVIFSITPTPGVYSNLHSSSLHSTTQAHNQQNVRSSPVCFLHRPWSLDRKAVPRGALVLASHVSFDAHLTVGWNVALAARLDIDVDDAKCVQGYKGDPERKIGLVGKLNTPVPLSAITRLIQCQFDGAGELHHSQGEAFDETLSYPQSIIDVIAIMNAFHGEEVERVVSVARDLLLTSSDAIGPRVLYLTGAAREHGLASAKEANMPVLCVGHRACEEWGIKYLTQMTRERWPALDVIEILEEEEKPEKLAGPAMKAANSSDKQQHPT